MNKGQVKELLNEIKTTIEQLELTRNFEFKDRDYIYRIIELEAEILSGNNKNIIDLEVRLFSTFKKTAMLEKAMHPKRKKVWWESKKKPLYYPFISFLEYLAKNDLELAYSNFKEFKHNYDYWGITESSKIGDIGDSTNYLALASESEWVDNSKSLTRISNELEKIINNTRHGHK